MSAKPPARLAVDEKGYGRAHSRSPSPSRRKKANKSKKQEDSPRPLSKGHSGSQKPETNPPKQTLEQKSKDNDIFLLPSSDYQILGILTVIGVCIRLFKISQPSSVVFDEVQ